MRHDITATGAVGMQLAPQALEGASLGLRVAFQNGIHLFCSATEAKASVYLNCTNFHL